MKITQILKKISDRLPWWAIWILDLIPIGFVIEQIQEHPEVVESLLLAWGVPTAFVGIIITSVLKALKDSPVKKDDVKKVLIMSLLIGSFFFNVNSYAQTPDRGLSSFKSVDLDETEEAIKTSQGSIFCYYFYNKHATDTRFFKLYNDTVANVIVGTTTPKKTYPVPAKGGANVCISPNNYYTNGMYFDTAITAACTTGEADNDTGAPSAGDCIINIDYK